MSGEGLYRAPDIPAEKVTPILVRDELLRCFESANREFLKILNQPIDETTLREQVHQFVIGAFQRCGASFESPTKQGILLAIDECKQNAESMMGTRAKDIIDHHYHEMMKLVRKLPD